MLSTILHLLFEAEILMRHYHPVHHPENLISCRISRPGSYLGGCTTIRLWPHGLRISW